MYDKATFLCFIYMQPQKLKFKSVQINMKQVSYHKRTFHTELNLLRLKDRVGLIGTTCHGIQEETKNMLYKVKVGQVNAMRYSYFQ